jgi:hypothetical protein
MRRFPKCRTSAASQQVSAFSLDCKSDAPAIDKRPRKLAIQEVDGERVIYDAACPSWLPNPSRES